MSRPDAVPVETSPGARELLPGTVALVDEYVGDKSALGVQIEVVRPTGERFRVVSTHPGLGYRLDSDTTFRWYCSIKTVLAFTVLTLLRRRGLTSDVPVCSLLPQFTGGGREAITVYHLLTHTSGLPSFPHNGTALGPDLTAAALATPLPEGQVPGEVTSYNICTAWTLVAAIVEELSGLDIVDATHQTAFGPFGLKDTVLAARSADDRRLITRVARMVTGQPERRLLVFTKPDVLATMPAWIGGLSTLADLADLFAHLLRLRQGAGSADEHEVVMDLTARSRGPAHDETLGRPVDYARGTIVDVSTAGFGPGWSPDSFGVGGSVDYKIVIGAWADPRREVACAVALPGVSPMNSVQMYRLGQRLAADFEEAGWKASP